MRNERGNSSIVTLGTLLIAGGVFLAMWDLVNKNWPMAYPLAAMGAGVLLVALGWLASLGPTDGSVNWLQRSSASLALLMLLGFCAVLWNQIGARRIVTHQMTWKMGKPGGPREDVPHVILAFERCPHKTVGIYSSDLPRYLKEFNGKKIPVIFEVVYDFKKVRRFKTLQIGKLNRWDNLGSYHHTGPRPKSSTPGDCP